MQKAILQKRHLDISNFKMHILSRENDFSCNSLQAWIFAQTIHFTDSQCQVLARLVHGRWIRAMDRIGEQYYFMFEPIYLGDGGVN